MKEWFLQGNGLYVVAALGLIGIVSRYVVQCCLHHMTVQTEKGNSSRNRILQQIKSRFENIYRMNSGIDQMEAFVQKQICLLRFLGLRLSTWKVISDQMLLVVLLFGGGSSVICWQNEGTGQAFRYLLLSAVVVMLQCFCYLWNDIARRERELVVNLEDYLGNTYAVHLRRGMNRENGKESAGEAAEGNTAPAAAEAAAAKVGPEQNVLSREEKGATVRPGKPAGGNGRRVLTAEESKLIEDILREYLN